MSDGSGLTDLVEMVTHGRRGAEVGSWATFSRNRNCRFVLGKLWKPNTEVACWIMLNPSTADHIRDDPTLRKVTRLTAGWGYGGLVVVNLLPVISPDPGDTRDWYRFEECGGWDRRDLMIVNTEIVVTEARAADLVVAAWGAARWAEALAEQMVDDIQSTLPAPAIYCLGVTSSGAPKHPLARGRNRVPDDQALKVWRIARSALA